MHARWGASGWYSCGHEIGFLQSKVPSARRKMGASGLLGQGHQTMFGDETKMASYWNLPQARHAKPGSTINRLKGIAPLRKCIGKLVC